MNETPVWLSFRWSPNVLHSEPISCWKFKRMLSAGDIERETLELYWH